MLFWSVVWLLDFVLNIDYSSLVLTLFIVTCLVNPTVKYFTKFAFGTVYFSTGCLIISVLEVVFGVKSAIAISFGQNWMHSLLWLLGIVVDYRGMEHLSDRYPAIVMANHQNIIDIALFSDLMLRLENQINVVVKKSVFWRGPVGLVARNHGFIAVERNNKSKDIDAISRAATIIKERKTKLWLFPEGSRNQGGPTMLPFRKGGFHAAIDHQLPVVPVVISPYHFFAPTSSGKRRFDSGKVIVQALPPVSTEGLTKDQMEELIARVRYAICDQYKLLDNELVYIKA